MLNHFLKLFLLLGVILCFGNKNIAQVFKKTNPKDIALYPIQNQYRNMKTLNGIWNFKVDKDQKGIQDKWFDGLTNFQPIAVPGSWNDQYDSLRDFLGWAWYETEFYVPNQWLTETLFLRLGAVVYSAKIWLNGQPIACHEGGHLPFAMSINNYLKKEGKNKLVVLVDNIMNPTRIPVGGLQLNGFFSNNLNTNFDYFPYSGIHRDVILYSLPKHYIRDITINTALNGNLKFIVEPEGKVDQITIEIQDNISNLSENFVLNTIDNQYNINLKNPILWELNNPHLYQATLKLLSKHKIIDEYQLNFGIRSVRSDQNYIYLNEKPIKLKGFGKHEDFPIFGKGTANPVIIKDFSLLKWIGANSFRTSHYPYDEINYDLADKLGMLIIDESPAVGVVFDDGLDNNAQRKAQTLQTLTEMIYRDKNHPSIIMWSLMNEPISNPKYPYPKTIKDIDLVAYNFFKDLSDSVRHLDPSRLQTITNISNFMPEVFDSSYNFLDIIAVNLYFGWYSQFGDIQKASQELNKEVQHLYIKTKKPIFISEFGGDTYPGNQQLNPEMFSEEYQVELMKINVEAGKKYDFICGLHVWNFADFKTAQGLLRVNGMNYKGVFTRERNPKKAAYYLKSVWD